MSLWVWKQHAERGCEYMVLDRRASSRCTLGLDCYAPLFGTMVHGCYFYDAAFDFGIH